MSLVLLRRKGETIHIGEDVIVEVRRLRSGSVLIAVKAPEDVRILRGELVEPNPERAA